MERKEEMMKEDVMIEEKDLQLVMEYLGLGREDVVDDKKEG